jgi:hypothetical protein
MQNYNPKFKIKPRDKKKYILAKKEDYRILEMAYRLEKCRLSKYDKMLAKFVKSQLEDDWRTPLVRFTKLLLTKYRNQ